MATITDYRLLPFRRFKSEQSFWARRFHKGRESKVGQGLTFLFRPAATSVAEVPVADQELTFGFRGRSADFQDIAVQGVVTYRIFNPQLAVAHFDFTVDLSTGAYLNDPTERLESLFSQLTQQASLDYLAATDADQILAQGMVELRDRISQALTDDQALGDQGLRPVSVVLSALRPDAELEKAMRAPAFEATGKVMDNATYDRRANAVDQERAINEAELRNRIALAEKDAELIQREGQNARTRTDQQIELEALRTAAAADQKRLNAAVAAEITRANAEAEAQATRITGDAENEVLKARLDVEAAVGTDKLLALALDRLGGNLGELTHLTIAPDLLSQLLTAGGTNGQADYAVQQ